MSVIFSRIFFACCNAWREAVPAKAYLGSSSQWLPQDSGSFRLCRGLVLHQPTVKADVHIFLGAAGVLGGSCQQGRHFTGFGEQTLCQRHTLNIHYLYLLESAKKTSRASSFLLQSVWIP
jgi:hypothetical protein